jgi:hypothetical protein
VADYNKDLIRIGVPIDVITGTEKTNDTISDKTVVSDYRRICVPTYVVTGNDTICDTISDRTLVSDKVSTGDLLMFCAMRPTETDFLCVSARVSP